MKLIDIAPGKQITVSVNGEKVWLALWSNGGSLGIELSPKQVMELKRALFDSVYSKR